MREIKPLPSRPSLLERFSYDPETGVFMRRKNGKIFPQKQDWFIGVDGDKFKMHRLIWKMMTGQDPVEIDHIDGDPTNNRWSNLRNATSADNNHNRKMDSRNTSGVKGVCWHSTRRKWLCRISNHRRSPRAWSAWFDNLYDAISAIEAKRRELHGEFARDF